MVQDELIGTITKEGITYTTKRNIDIEDIIIKTFDDFKEYSLLNKKEKLLFKDTRLIKANKKFYFEKLDDSRLSILKAHSISILKGLEYDD